MQLRWRSAHSLDLKLNFHRWSVNFDVDHRLVGKRVCVDASLGSGVRVRTTCACTLNASKRTSRWTVVLQKTGRRRTALYSEIKWQTVIVRWLSLRFMKMIELTTNQKTNWRWRANQQTNKNSQGRKRLGGNLVLTWLRTYVLVPNICACVC